MIEKIQNIILGTEKINFFQILIALFLIALIIAIIFLLVAVSFWILEGARGLMSKDQDTDELVKELKESNKKLKELDKSKSEFIDIASHELNTPIATVRGYLSMVTENIESKNIDIETIKLIKKAEESAEELVKVVEKLLESSQSAQKEEKSPFQINGIITELVRKYEKQARDKRIEVNYIAPDVLPIPLAFGMPNEIKEAIDNILDNAVKFTNEGTIVVELTIQKKSSTMQISIKDTGRGIPKEEMSHLFEKFYQVESTATRTVGGTGMGLCGTKNLIEKNNGKIKVESELGKGTTVVFTIPLA